MGSFRRTAMLRQSCHSEGPRQTGVMDQQELWGNQKRQKGSPAFACQETIATIRVGDWLGSSSAERDLEVLVDTSRLRVSSREGQKCPGLHEQKQSQEMEQSDYSTCSAASRILGTQYRKDTSELEQAQKRDIKMFGDLKGWGAGCVQLGVGHRVAQQQFSNALLYRMCTTVGVVCRLNRIFCLFLVFLCLTYPTLICHDAYCFAFVRLNCTLTWLLCYSLKLYCCYCLVCTLFFWSL